MNTTKQLPTYWRGVDAQALPGGEVLIDWTLVRNTLDEVEGNVIHAYNLLSNLAIDARDEGELAECGYLASHALVCLNYGDSLNDQ